MYYSIDPQGYIRNKLSVKSGMNQKLVLHDRQRGSRYVLQTEELEVHGSNKNPKPLVNKYEHTININLIPPGHLPLLEVYSALQCKIQTCFFSKPKTEKALKEKITQCSEQPSNL